MVQPLSGHSTRRIERLYSAHITTRPPNLPRKSRKGDTSAQTAGHRYEKRVVSALRREGIGRFHYHPWVRFVDAHGMGACEPEGYFEFLDHVLLIECKLTARPECWPQIEELYKPVLEHALGLPVRCLMIARNLLPTSRRPFYDDVWHFINSPAMSGTVHWTL